MTTIGEIEEQLREASLKEERKCGKCGAYATLVCSRCRDIRYCNPTCQRAHWREHKPECRLPAETPPMPIDPAQLSVLMAACADLKLTEARARLLLQKNRGELINAMVEATGGP